MVRGARREYVHINFDMVSRVVSEVNLDSESSFSSIYITEYKYCVH